MVGQKKNRWYITPIAAICVIIFLMGILFAKKPPITEVAVRINDYTLTAEEFNELFADLKMAEDTPQGRSDFLHTLVTRKLLLQEAQKEGLDKKKEFMKAIEGFWEQSLLKMVVDKKVKDIYKSITVTDKEAALAYKEWTTANPDDTRPVAEIQKTIKWQLLKKKQKLAIDVWTEALRIQSRIKIDKKAVGAE